MATAKNTEQKRFLAKLTPEDVGGKPRSMRFVLGNGVEVVGCLDDYSAEMIERLALHGLSQKIGDSAASFSKDRDFHGAFSAMQQTEDNLRNGLWSSRAGGGTSDLVQVLAEMQGCELEAAQAAVDKMNEEQLAAVKKHPAVKKTIADLVAKRAAEAAKASGVEDLGEMLKGIGLGKAA